MAGYTGHNHNDEAQTVLMHAAPDASTTHNQVDHSTKDSLAYGFLIVYALVVCIWATTHFIFGLQVFASTFETHDLFNIKSLHLQSGFFHDTPECVADNAHQAREFDVLYDATDHYTFHTTMAVLHAFAMIGFVIVVLVYICSYHCGNTATHADNKQAWWRAFYAILLVITYHLFAVGMLSGLAFWGDTWTNIESPITITGTHETSMLSNCVDVYSRTRINGTLDNGAPTLTNTVGKMDCIFGVSLLSLMTLFVNTVLFPFGFMLVYVVSLHFASTKQKPHHI
jgi:hypothetical protein